jgi:hypothetical protein
MAWPGNGTSMSSACAGKWRSTVFCAGSFVIPEIVGF